MENGWTKRIEELEKMVDNLHSVIESDEKLVEELTEKLKATEEEMLFWRRESRLSDAGLKMAEDKIKELEVERDAAVRWLEEYKSKTYCAYCGATFNIDSDASHVSEHIRTCPHHPMRELEAENKRLRELVDGARVIVEVFQWSTPAQERWREEWLTKAAKTLKEASNESK